MIFIRESKKNCPSLSTSELTVKFLHGLITLNFYLEFMSAGNYNFYALSFLFLTKKPTSTLKNLMRYVLLGERRLEKSVNFQKKTLLGNSMVGT